MWSPTGGWVGRFPDGPAKWRWVFLSWSVLTEVDLDGSRPDPSDIREIYWTYHTDGVRRINYIVGWRTQDLYGSFEIRQEASQELFARFEAQVSINLPGRLIVRHSDLVELLGRFEVGQDSADLLCKFEVGQGSADLLCKGEITQVGFIELLGKVLITRPGSEALFAKFELSTIQFSLREHKTYAAWDPAWSYTKSSASILRGTSTTSALGKSYFFFVVSRDWLHGKYIRVTWKADVYVNWGNSVYIYDGAYNRSSDVDFPSGAGKLIKGNGLLQTLLTHTGDFGSLTEEGQVDVSGGSEPLVTVFIQSSDSWSGQSGYYQIDTVEINSGAGGSGTLYREPFNDSITMEKTGTTGDYGYISKGGPPKAGSRELYASFTVNP